MIKKFNQLSLDGKKLATLMWTYEFGNVMSVVFGTIYVYCIRNSLTDVATMLLLLFTSLRIGFVLGGIIYSTKKINLKYGFVGAYMLLMLGFVSLGLSQENLTGVYIYSALQGTGLGLFRLSLINYEIKAIENTTRDIYGSIREFGRKGIAILSPAIMGGLLYLSQISSFDSPYQIGFIISILLYVGSMIISWTLGSFTAPSVETISRKHIREKKQYYLFFMGSGTGILFGFIISLIGLDIFESDLNVGIFETGLAIISLLLILYTSKKRTIGNRYQFFLWTGMGTIILFLILAGMYSPVALIIYGLGMTVIRPLHSVSTHIYTLSSIQTLGVNAFSASLIRDTCIFGARIIYLGIFRSVSRVFEMEIALKICLLLLAVLKIIQTYAAKHIEQDFT